jgi:hypothetical protein
VPAYFANRKAVSEAKIHTPIQQGINGYGKNPAASVVSSASKKTYFSHHF